MRLGDLDALTEKLKNGLENAKNAGKENYAKIFEVFIDWVSREPTIDPVPVVRCRECKFYREFRTKRYNQLMCMCYRMGKHDMEHPVKPDDFCSYGQRKIETVLPKSDAKDESLEAKQ